MTPRDQPPGRDNYGQEMVIREQPNYSRPLRAGYQEPHSSHRMGYMDEQPPSRDYHMPQREGNYSHSNHNDVIKRERPLEGSPGKRREGSPRRRSPRREVHQVRRDIREEEPREEQVKPRRLHRERPPHEFHPSPRRERERTPETEVKRRIRSSPKRERVHRRLAPYPVYNTRPGSRKGHRRDPEPEPSRRHHSPEYHPPREHDRPRRRYEYVYGYPEIRYHRYYTPSPSSLEELSEEPIRSTPEQEGPKEVEEQPEVREPTPKPPSPVVAPKRVESPKQKKSKPRHRSVKLEDPKDEEIGGIPVSKKRKSRNKYHLYGGRKGPRGSAHPWDKLPQSSPQKRVNPKSKHKPVTGHLRDRYFMDSEEESFSDDAPPAYEPGTRNAYPWYADPSAIPKVMQPKKKEPLPKPEVNDSPWENEYKLNPDR